MLAKIAKQASRPAHRTSRRGFLAASAAATGGLVVGFRSSGISARAPAADAAVVSPFDAYLTIGTDGRVTVLSSQFEMGQGAYHGLATLVAEELDAAWDEVHVEGRAGNVALYGNPAWGGAVQGTGGSTSIAGGFLRYRRAGAAARALLVAAAADRWGVPAEEITVEAGVLRHGSARRAGFGELAARAATMPVPAEPKLKSAADWQLIGADDLRRNDSMAKATGREVFTIDLDLPGMLTAVMIHPPRFGATVASFDATDAKTMPGVVDVVSTPRGVAVVAEHLWAALQGRDAVIVRWDESAAETRGSVRILDDYRALAVAAPGAVARADGDVEATLADADRVVEAMYTFPFLAHAALEPLNAVARMNADGTLEVWGGHQTPDAYQLISAQIAEIDPSRVTLHVMKTGGSFGRRAVADGDVVAEAVMVAKAMGFTHPVKVQWTRENDMRGGRYRPAYVHRLRAALDAAGDIVAWDHHVVGQSILRGTPFEAMLVRNGVDLTSVEGANTLPYAIPNLRVGLTTTDVRVPVLWWRAVGSTHTAFATECFLDEVADALGRDPLELRLALLAAHPRHAAVLRLAAEKAGWGEARAEGRYLGLAVHESFNSFVAQVAEVSVAGGDVRVHRVVVAVDCGIVVNPDTVRAQMEGGVGFGLGSVLQEELTLTDGAVDQANYDTYGPLRIDQMPEVEVHIVQSSEAPTGVGEPGVPPIGPAVANAVHAATGRRVRTLPLRSGLA